MIKIIKELKNVEINGKHYETVQEFINENPSGVTNVTIIINKEDKKSTSDRIVAEEKNAGEKIYRLKVRQYMTKQSTPDFPFHTKWNSDIPMPMRIMVGKILKETKGMYQMELWGQITSETTTICMACGKALTNPVSQYFGIGPECGGHNYINPFKSDEELKKAVEDTNKRLMTEKKWTGWVIKSAIEEFELIRP